MVNCLLLVTGSVAAIKTLKLRAEILKLLPPNSEVRIVVTQAAQHFLKPNLLQKPDEETEKEENSHHPQSPPIKFFCDQDEWDSYQKRGDPVLHIELRKWADICCLAPLDANSLAKISHGMADNLLTCVMRAWEWKKKPVVLAPAMNTAMWEHPLTRPQLEIIRGFNPEMVTIVEPVSKVLECNDVGVGALAPLEDIAKTVAMKSCCCE
jgi:phosphopantothenoylcysteine decarboxylase